jgi:mono/diheme cytochrome c family protein
MPHLSELHGASTHLAVVAIPVFAILHFVRRAGRGGTAVLAAEPWALAASVVGVALSGITGLLVWGQAQTTLRGADFTIGSVHFWLGIAIAAFSVGVSVDWYLSRRREGARHGPVVVPILAVLIVIGVAVQGYLGGRMTYHRAVGVFDGGELAQSASGASRLRVALARGMSEVAAGKQAFSESGLGCASCHGDLAEGDRGPSLAGGRELEEFRRVHGHGLFPAKIVTDRDFAAINAWLQTLPRSRRGGDDEHGASGDAASAEPAE